MGSGMLNVLISFIFWTYHLYAIHKLANKEELFNLCHSSAWNVTERIFGVLKQRFWMLLIAPEYSLKIQAQIPAALCAIHNFIWTYETDDMSTEPDYFDNHTPNNHDHAASAAAAAELDRPSEKWGEITQQMWDDYMCIHSERAASGEDQLEDNDDELSDEEVEVDKDKEDEGEVGYVTV